MEKKDESDAPDHQSNSQSSADVDAQPSQSRRMAFSFRSAISEPLSSAVVFRDTRGDCFLKLGKGTTVRRLDSPQSSLLIRHLYADRGYFLVSKEVGEIVDHLRSVAQLSSDVREVWIRVAPIPDGIEIDIGDDTDARIRVTPGRVEVVSGGSTTLFNRTPVMWPFVLPAENGDLKLLDRYLNLSPSDRQLLIAWISYVLAHPKSANTSFPPLALISPQGGGKTTGCRRIRSLIDPSIVDVQTFPSSERDLAAAVQMFHLSTYDNVRTIPLTMSDALCRVATGGALVKRRLYTDAEVVTLQLHGAVILNGIHPFIDQPDLAQRCLQLKLLPINERDRCSESSLNADFQRDLPQIFRGLLDLIAGIFIHLPSVQPTSPERMIDFVRWLAAIERFYGIPGDPYQTAYSEALKEGMRDSLEENPLAAAILELAEGIGNRPWSGMPTELLDTLNRRVRGRTHYSPEWPANAISLSKRLKPLVPVLRQHGVEIRFGRGADRRITIERAEGTSND